MAERPILFSGPMVRAILEGRKTVTRRLVKPQPFDDRYYQDSVFLDLVKDGVAYFSAEAVGGGAVRECDVTGPYQVGDRLYVRETYFGNHFAHPDEPEDEREIHYRADGYGDFEGERIVWTPSIHMPKWAARIWLEVTAVRVERLQDITEDQAHAEGVDNHMAAAAVGTDSTRGDCLPATVHGFAHLWDALAKPGTRWADNPWVWVAEFRRVEGPNA